MNKNQTKALLEEVRSYAEAAKSQIDRGVVAIQNLVEEHENNTTRAPEEIIYPSAEMLELR